MSRRKVSIVVKRQSDGKKVCRVKLSKEEFNTVLLIATAAGMSLEELIVFALRDTVNNSEKCID